MSKRNDQGMMNHYIFVASAAFVFFCIFNSYFMVSIFKAIRDNDTQLLNYFIELATHDASSSSLSAAQAVSKQTSQWIQQQLKSSGQKQFDLNKRSSRGKTALHYAVTWNRVEMASALINCAQVDVNIRDRENGWTALHR